MISTGIVRYTLPYKINVEVDPELVRYYRSLAPVRLNKTFYSPHITVMRNEDPHFVVEPWGKHEGREIQFEYSPIVKNDSVYWWLEVYSKELEDIRINLGLFASSKLTRPPDGSECFHITIGNQKNISK